MLNNRRKKVSTGRWLTVPVMFKTFMKAEDTHSNPDDYALLIQRYNLLHDYTIANQEAERKQIAAYMNDTAVQSLTALHIQLSLLLSKPQTEEALQIQLADSLNLVSKLVEEMAKLARTLRPLELDTLGLNAALQQACEEFSHLSLIPVSYKGVELDFLSEAETVAFYRLAQEALINILKHAQATKVQVNLQVESHRVTLSIHDNGRGFSSPAETMELLSAPGLTLFGLMLTFKHLNGRVTLQSTPGEGTTVTAVLPYF